jgi:hypothetical protein
MGYLINHYCKICRVQWEISGDGVGFEYIFSWCECEDTIRQYQKSIDNLGIKAFYARPH